MSMQNRIKILMIREHCAGSKYLQDDLKRLMKNSTPAEKKKIKIEIYFLWRIIRANEDYLLFLAGEDDSDSDCAELLGNLPVDKLHMKLPTIDDLNRIVDKILGKTDGKK